MLLEIYIEDDYIGLKSTKYSNNKNTVVKVVPTKKLYYRVKALQQLVKEANCAYAEDWDYSPEFEDVQMDGGEGDLNLDICRMCVDKNTIHWKGVIKHTTMHVYTETISIDKLFHKFINSKITGSNNSTDYEELRLIADHAVEGFDTDTCVTLAYDYVLNFLDSCTNIELEKQKELYNYPED